MYKVFDSSSFVRGPVNVKDFERFFKLLDIKSRISCIILVNEFSSAPLSMSARVSTVSFSIFPLICIGMDKEFDSILVVLTLKMSRQGETDVEAVLLFKNPVLPTLSKTCLSLRHSYLSADFECVDGVLFHYISSSVSKCQLNRYSLFQDVPVFHSQSTTLFACIQHVVRVSFDRYPLRSGPFW